MVFHIAREAAPTGDNNISEPSWLESMDPTKKKWVLGSIAALATAAFIGVNVYHGLTGSHPNHDPAAATNPKAPAPTPADLLGRK